MDKQFRLWRVATNEQFDLPCIVAGQPCDIKHSQTRKSGRFFRLAVDGQMSVVKRTTDARRPDARSLRFLFPRLAAAGKIPQDLLALAQRQITRNGQQTPVMLTVPEVRTMDRMAAKLGNLEKPSSIRNTRKDIARVKTILTEKAKA